MLFAMVRSATFKLFGRCKPHDKRTGTVLRSVSALGDRHMDPAGNFNLQAGAVKAIYLAPTRALVQVRHTAHFSYRSIILCTCCR